MRVLDLFSCIGFHSLGLQRASTEFEVVALCESNPRRREELARLHPGVPIYDDVRSLPAVEADIVFGGPPCQRTSVAAAIHGHRDGASLWPYMLCASIDAGAEWIVVEQPPGNEAWEAQVYRHLSRSGYHSAKFRFGAEDVGGPYPRRRDYIIACTSLPRLEIAWQAGPSAIERAKRSADARGDWDPNSIPAFDLDTWRSEDVHERKERIEALGDSNPPAMAEVIGYMISDAMLAPTPEPNVRWIKIDDEAREAGRILLLWKPFGAVGEHVELGWWNGSKDVWVNTYGKAFSFPPDQWSRLAPYNPWGHVPCPCTTFEQEEDCPVGFPSLLCAACSGTGNATQDTVVALAAEMLKVAEQVDELEDPFAAWESIDLLKSQNGKMGKTLEFYANPEIYKPHPHGLAFDRSDLSFHARAALSTTATEGE